MDTKPEALTYVKAYPNIALIKYWGKFDNDKHLPYNSSLSISVDTIYTLTSARIIDAKEDIFYLNNELVSEKELSKMTAYLDKIRAMYDKKAKLEIKSTNFFPTAAGLASSASGYAALAKAIDIAYNLKLEDKELSSLARIGSVSAARSIFGGFVALEAKAESAYPFAKADDYAVIFIVIDSAKKATSSRKGMKHTVETSAFYDGWLQSTKNDFEEMKQAIQAKDFTAIGELTESSCLKMHATMLAAKPYFSYLKPKTIETIEIIKKIRAKGLECYFTIDAGANVKVLTKKNSAKKILEELKQYFSDNQLILCHTSNAYEIVEGEYSDRS